MVGWSGDLRDDPEYLPTGAQFGPQHGMRHEEVGGGSQSELMLTLDSQGTFLAREDIPMMVQSVGRKGHHG